MLCGHRWTTIEQPFRSSPPVEQLYARQLEAFAEMAGGDVLVLPSVGHGAGD